MKQKNLYTDHNMTYITSPESELFVKDYGTL